MMTFRPNLATHFYLSPTLLVKKVLPLQQQAGIRWSWNQLLTSPLLGTLSKSSGSLFRPMQKLSDKVAAKDSDDSAPVVISTVVERPKRVSSNTKVRGTTISTALDATATIAEQRGLTPGAF
jgi:hypothetical protein